MNNSPKWDCVAAILIVGLLIAFLPEAVRSLYGF